MKNESESENDPPHLIDIHHLVIIIRRIYYAYISLAVYQYFSGTHVYHRRTSKALHTHIRSRPSFIRSLIVSYTHSNAHM